MALADLGGRGGSRTCEKGVLCSPNLAIAAQTSRGGAALLLSMLTGNGEDVSCGPNCC